MSTFMEKLGLSAAAVAASSMFGVLLTEKIFRDSHSGASIHAAIDTHKLLTLDVAQWEMPEYHAALEILTVAGLLTSLIALFVLRPNRQ